MRWSRVLAILNKDILDGLRDGRVLVGLLLPIALAVIYNVTAPERNQRPTSQVVVVDPGNTGIARGLEEATRRTVELEVTTASDEAAARRMVSADDQDLAVIAGPRGSSRATVVVPNDGGPATQTVAGVVPDVVAALSGRPPGSQVRVEAVAPDRAEQTPLQIIEPRVLFIAGSIVLLAGFVALLIVPIQTAEELETGTFGALRLAATGPEILAAKALGGMYYGLVGTAVTMVIVRPELADPVLFVVAAILLTMSMVGFGLLLGLLVQNANLINSYGAFLVFPLVGLAVAVLFVNGGLFATVLDFLPFSQAMKLLTNGLAPEQPFDIGILPYVVILVWTVFGFGLLARYATRREV